MWKQIRIDVNTGNIDKADISEEYKMQGGRALIGQVLMKEVNPKCDPLGPENKLIFTLGIFAGTNIPTAHRLNVGGKSPLTGGIKESNVGGTMAQQLANQGIKLIIVENKPENENWKILFIDKKGEISLIDADEYMGLNNYAIAEKAIEKYGKDVSVASIGTAGEKLYRNSGIAVTEFGTNHPCRLAARGGLGTLMASKGIKALIVEKPENKFKPDIADPELLANATKEFTKFVASVAGASAVASIGTVANIAVTSASAVLPVRNFSGGFAKKEVANLGPQKFLEKLGKNGGRNNMACQAGCCVKCSNQYHGDDGKYITAGFEYETLALCGPNIDIYDMDTIAKIDRICDDMGLDTIETGCTLGVCMEAGKIPWGDADAVFKLLEEMQQGTEFGKIMGEGTEACGKYLGCKRIPTVKHQAMAAYEPRNLKGTGVTYAVSPQGADHTAGVTLGTKYDATTHYAQAFLSRTMQTLSAFADSSFCLFAWFYGGVKRMDLVVQMYTAIYGVEFSPREIPLMGVKTLLTERAFNKMAGFTPEDDRMPDFLLEEPSPATGATFDFNDAQLDAIFNF